MNEYLLAIFLHTVVIYMFNNESNLLYFINTCPSICGFERTSMCIDCYIPRFLYTVPSILIFENYETCFKRQMYLIYVKFNIPYFQI